MIKDSTNFTPGQLIVPGPLANRHAWQVTANGKDLENDYCLVSPGPPAMYISKHHNGPVGTKQRHIILYQDTLLSCHMFGWIIYAQTL